MTRRAALFALGSLAIVGMGHSQAKADDELPKVIRIVVPFEPGGVTDIYARQIAEKLGKRLKRTVLVENKPGAAGWIGTRYVANGPKDGSILMSYSISLLTNAATTSKPSVDVMSTIAPVAIMSEVPLIVGVSSSSKIRTPSDLLEAARANPEGLTYSTAGAGTTVHLISELLAAQSGVKLMHVPYKGGAAANNDVAGGFVDFTMAVPSTLQPLIEGGRIHPVAVTTAEPTSAFPGIPTMASAVPGYEASVWTALWAPAGTPQPLLERLNKEVTEIVKSGELDSLIESDGGKRVELGYSETREKVQQSYRLWKDLATARNIVVGS